MNKNNIIYHKNITLEQALSGGNFFIYLDNGKKVKVNIHPGVNNGQIIRLKDFGDLSDTEIKSDIFIELKVLDHPLYKIQGVDLHAPLVVTPAEAQIGCSKTMPGPDGKKLTVAVPAGSKHGNKVIVENAGISGKDETGNIHFEILIEDIASFKTIYQSFISPNENNTLN
ncbi:MAG: hypothetical protein D8M58_03930 [Calditrichaeota bacterium]|nr:MAG: hypothetical protein DWQ03_03145 [Calditrichota bacterium]MBL1204517.1 hypothetical protein [Calditrichota bacterium]NOG44345.1 hypothetical protein [Calditrichota bacterium]